jgi:hypothetical protein
MQAGHVSASAGAQQLQQLQESGVQLEARSLQLLALSADASAQQEFASTSSSSESCSLSCITCMIAIPQAADQVRLACVLGSQAQQPVACCTTVC